MSIAVDFVREAALRAESEAHDAAVWKTSAFCGQFADAFIEATDLAQGATGASVRHYLKVATLHYLSHPPPPPPSLTHTPPAPSRLLDVFWQQMRLQVTCVLCLPPSLPRIEALWSMSAPCLKQRCHWLTQCVVPSPSKASLSSNVSPHYNATFVLLVRQWCWQLSRLPSSLTSC